jgi:hypothetical protein
MQDGNSLPKKISEKLVKNGVDLNTIEICQLAEDDKQMHYWYGGNVIDIKYRDAIFTIQAIGDIRFTLFDREDDRQLFYVKDKTNGGFLYQDLSEYINSDEELMSLLMGEHPKYTCEIENNNWWECGIIRDAEYNDLMWDLESDTISDAILEVYFDMENAYIDTFGKAS